jgi:hypothetical protein
MFAFTLRVGLFGLVLGLLASSSAAGDDKKVELNVGAGAPAFEARTDADTTWESSARFGKKWVVNH